MSEFKAGYDLRGYNDDHLLPIDIVIQVFVHLHNSPEDLLNCALTTRRWTQSALQELYRHPWTYLFTYQFDTEGRVMDKYGSMLLLRTLFQGCMDPSRTAFPYASFARSVNLKWVHDTFEFPEVDIQTLTGIRWTRNEAPKDFLIRHLLAHRPYLTDFIHCHASKLPRCHYTHLSSHPGSLLNDDGGVATNVSADDGVGTHTEPSSIIEPTQSMTSSADTNSNTSTVGSDMEWVTFTQASGSNDLDGTEERHAVASGSGSNSSNVSGNGQDESLLATSPLPLPVHQQQSIATAMPLALPVSSSSAVSIPPISSDTGMVTTESPAYALEEHDDVEMTELPPLAEFYTPDHSNIPTASAAVASASTESTSGPNNTASLEMSSESSSTSSTLLQGTASDSVLDSVSDIPSDPAQEAELEMATSDSAPHTALHPQLSHLFHSSTSFSATSSSSRQFLGAWPLTMNQTVSLTFLDLRYAIVSDALVISLSKICRRIESLKIVTHWQKYHHSFSVTDRALATLVRAQLGIKLLHVDNNCEISQGHSLVETIDALAEFHGATLETLVLKSHDYQNCNLIELGKRCERLIKFSAPGGTHLMREDVVKMTESCKLTLEHLDFSNSDVETECLTRILKGMSNPAAAKGVLKAMILLGMEDTLNQETCLAIGENATGLDCFRLDILESEARDVATMLSLPCGANLRVLTLGCHDVHGHLANEILEQIATNCRNVELLDVNHWQFSAKAIEKVLKECQMLRYVNLSFTDIGESTGEVICKCLGEPIEDAAASEEALTETVTVQDPVDTPQTLAPVLTLNEPLPAHGEGETTTAAATISTTVTTSMSVLSTVANAISMSTETPMEVVYGVETQQSAEESQQSRTMEETAAVIASSFSEAIEKGEEVNLNKNNMHKDDTTSIAVVTDADADSTANTEKSNDACSANSSLSYFGPMKKQSQMGLFHHHHHSHNYQQRPQNAMDLQTIMNLDLDEVDQEGIDLDMFVELQRYHRNSSAARERQLGHDHESQDREDDDVDIDIDIDIDIDDDIDIDMDVDEYVEEIVKEDDECGEEGDQYGCGYGNEEVTNQTFKQSKGKEVHVDYMVKSASCPGVEAIPYTQYFSVFSSSVDTHASSSTSSSLPSSSSSFSEYSPSLSPKKAPLHKDLSQDGNAVKEDREKESDAGPLLPPLPIPSRDHRCVEDLAVAVAPELSNAEIGTQTGAIKSGNESVDVDVEADSDGLIPASDTAIEPDENMEASVPMIESTPESPLSSSDLSLSEISSSSSLSESSSSLGSPSIDTGTPATTASTEDSEKKEPRRDLSWTVQSRLEQVNVECCSQLSFATMTRIKILASSQQAKRLHQGQKKCRIWLENEHDMMMTRLAMERGHAASSRPRQGMQTDAHVDDVVAISELSESANESEILESITLDVTSESVQGMETVEA